MPEDVSFFSYARSDAQFTILEFQLDTQSTL